MKISRGEIIKLCVGWAGATIPTVRALLFQQIVEQYVYAGTYNSVALAAWCETMPSAIMRWCRGKARPAPGLQRQVVRWIEEWAHGIVTPVQAFGQSNENGY